MPLIPARAWDDTLDIDMTVPSEAMRHPTLPAAMVDLRRPSRAVEALSANPAARVSSFGGVKQTWRQANRHGVPCFPGSFDDVSRRTVDIRTPDAANGHYHHKRLLAYSPPPIGLFPLDPIELEWNKRNDSLHEHLIEEKEEDGVRIVRNRTERIIEITDDTDLDAGSYWLEGLNFQTKLSVAAGGSLDLHRVEAAEVEVVTPSTDKPVLIAQDCLFDKLSVGSGIARLDSCTVLGTAYLRNVDATDSILMNVSDDQISGTIQYSRIPDNIKNNTDNRTVEDCTSDEPVFFSGQNTLTAKAVLAPNTPKSIHGGASDGGEMGYFHNGRKGRPVCVEGNQSLAIPEKGEHPLEDLIFQGNIKVSGGKFVLSRSAAESLTVSTALSLDANNEVIPALAAKDCLFDNLAVAKGLARLECCTVMKEAKCKYLQASDCIFAGPLTAVDKPKTNTLPPPFLNCIRYSSVPAELMDNIARKHRSDPVRKVAEALRFVDRSGEISLGSNTLETPIFLTFDYCTKDSGHWKSIRRPAEFGEYGYGVLAPITPDAIQFGAEDGGEIGAYHHRYYSLKAEAVLDKMREFLPVGIEPVLIQDTRLLRVPPEQAISEE